MTEPNTPPGSRGGPQQGSRHGSRQPGPGVSSAGLRKALQSGDSVNEPISPQVVTAYAELEAAYPEYIGRRPRERQLQLLQRGLQQAKAYGFEAPDLAQRFLHCVLLLDNDLSKATNSDVAYVLDTLTVPSKSKEKRLDRAIGLSRRIAEQAQRDAQAAPPSTAGGQVVLESAGSDDAASPFGPPLPSQDASVSMPNSPPKEAVRQNLPASSPQTRLRHRAAQPRKPAISVPPVEQAPEATSAGSLQRPALGADASPTATNRMQNTKALPTTAVSGEIEHDEHGLPQIAGFRIIERIASGGMGTVYRAHDLQLDIDVAIKVLRSLHVSAQQQFLLEARAAARLQHPHIVPVLRYEQYGQGGYCVMQLIKGTDAHRLIRRFAENASHELEAHRILEIASLDAAAVTPDLRALIRMGEPYYKFVAYWMAGVADGLDRAHAEGIIHYDVKPSNMMLAADGRLMLGDFGLATLAGREGGTSTSSCIGTPGYLSPEMLAGWACRSGLGETDSRVDVWGLGATLYEFLTFRAAYDGALAKVLRAIATTDPPKPCDVVWHTPAEMQRICLKAMARNPDERYRRVSEMADDLRAFLHGTSKPPGKPARPASGPLSWLKRPPSGE